MYGLKQADILAFKNLQHSLKPFEYAPVLGNVGKWKHATRTITFCLCVNDFRIKYHTKSDAQHLLDAIGKTTDTQLVRLAATIVESLWIGIIGKSMLICQCLFI